LSSEKIAIYLSLGCCAASFDRKYLKQTNDIIDLECIAVCLHFLKRLLLFHYSNNTNKFFQSRSAINSNVQKFRSDIQTYFYSSKSLTFNTTV